MRQRLASLVPAAAAAWVLCCSAQSIPQRDELWPQWQPHPLLGSAALLGDRYFELPALRPASALGGLRATGGLVLGSRGLAPQPGSWRAQQRWGFESQGGPAPWIDPRDTELVPYLGLGYTGLAAKNGSWGGWNFSADFGLVAGPGGLRGAGRALLGQGGTQWDDALRELRLSPLVQIGVRYSF